LTISVGGYIGGRVAGLYESVPVPTLFLICGATGVVAALALCTLIRPIAKMLEKRDDRENASEGIDGPSVPAPAPFTPSTSRRARLGREGTASAVRRDGAAVANPTYYADDMTPFHPTPHFAHWVPMRTETCSSCGRGRSEARARASEDYWYEQRRWNPYRAARSSSSRCAWSMTRSRSAGEERRLRR
jgi:hypothetical protein